jgi:hypothetical protein
MASRDKYAHKIIWLFVDSGVVELAMSYNPIFVILSSSKPLIFQGSLKMS